MWTAKEEVIEIAWIHGKTEEVIAICIHEDLIKEGLLHDWPDVENDFLN